MRGYCSFFNDYYFRSSPALTVQYFGAGLCRRRVCVLSRNAVAALSPAPRTEISCLVSTVLSPLTNQRHPFSRFGMLCREPVNKGCAVVSQAWRLNFEGRFVNPKKACLDVTLSRSTYANKNWRYQFMQIKIDDITDIIDRSANQKTGFIMLMQ